MDANNPLELHPFPNLEEVIFQDDLSHSAYEEMIAEHISPEGGNLHNNAAEEDVGNDLDFLEDLMATLDEVEKEEKEENPSADRVDHSTHSLQQRDSLRAPRRESIKIIKVKQAAIPVSEEEQLAMVGLIAFVVVIPWQPARDKNSKGLRLYKAEEHKEMIILTKRDASNGSVLLNVAIVEMNDKCLDSLGEKKLAPTTGRSVWPKIIQLSFDITRKSGAIGTYSKQRRNHAVKKAVEQKRIGYYLCRPREDELITSMQVIAETRRAILQRSGRDIFDFQLEEKDEQTKLMKEELKEKLLSTGLINV